MHEYVAYWHPFGYQVDWGNFPAWLGALLTSGTLALGLVLFYRTYRRDQRAQANEIALNKVNTFVDDADGHREITYTIWAYNASDNIIVLPRVEVRPAPDAMNDPKTVRTYFSDWDDKEDNQFVESPDFWRLDPKRTKRYTVELGRHFAECEVIFVFRDANGKVWTRDVKTYKLMKYTRGAYSASSMPANDKESS